ncbi:MAG: hypothetical protein NC253_00805 [Ruminococcus sp.]|nr:hypothetical protein [Ruminococcus sp.]MCM1380830.1 hypothetical protein [Muribaculaceae bacterium]MCM1480022.1 hypothetical protein [Muribaculaceae bacterium]
MKNKKIIFIIAALCCMLAMSACGKKQGNGAETGNSPNVTVSSAKSDNSETAVIDVFSELNVIFEGENGAGEIICEYVGDNDFIKYDVEFKPDRNGKYKNGDTAVARLDYSDYRAESANVFFKEKEREYTVEGLWGIILSAEGYDFSECNKALEERMFDKERTEAAKYKINDLDIGNTFWTTNVDGVVDPTEWEIISAEYEPLGKKLYVRNSDTPLNSYYVYYKVTLMGEKIKDKFVIDPESKYAVGDTKEWTYIIGEWTQNVYVEKNSDIIKINSEAFSNLNNDIFMSQTTIFGFNTNSTFVIDDFDEYYKEVIETSSYQNGEVYDIE